MKTELSLLEQIFFRGEYTAIIEGFERGDYDTHLAQNHREYAYVMGAMSFLGKLEDTERLLTKLVSHHLPLSTLSQCQFYYILLLTRLSHYKRAREQILRLLWRRNAPESESRFYALQALSFYRYYQGRYSDALKSGELALKAARGVYQNFLAKDLLGHAYSQLGLAAMGENFFQGALALANALGLKGFEKMVGFSLLGYQVERGENLARAQELVESELSQTPLESFYTRSELSLTLAKIYRLKGEKDRALTALNEAGLTIFRHHNRRHMALLYLNMAYIDGLDESFGRALQLLEVGLTQLDPQMDLDHQLKLKGLKFKILKTLGFSKQEELEALKDEIKKLTLKVGTPFAVKVFNRENNISESSQVTQPVQDNLGKILDRLSADTPLSELDLKEWENIYKDHLLGIIDQGQEREKYKSQTLFIVGKIPKSFIVGEKGNYTLIQKGFTSMSLKLCQLLFEKQALSKEEITRSLYGHEYNPLSHDSLIHALIARLRKSLGNYSWIIQNDDGLYKWSNQCVLIDCSGAEVAYESTKSETMRTMAQQAAPRMQLNIRQHKILERARKGELESIGPGEYREEFQVSRITATRDLTELCELGYFYTLGKARSISYIYENHVEVRS